MFSNPLPRRDFIRATLTGGAVVAAAGAGLLRSDSAMAGDVPGWPAKPFEDKTLSSAMMDSVGKTSVATSPKVKLTAPTIAENGGAVPVTVEIDFPMTADDYIDAVYLFVDHNPSPLVSKYQFTPESGQAYFQERIKMAKTDHIRVIAKSSKGVLMASTPREVKVTIGGCGG